VDAQSQCYWTGGSGGGAISLLASGSVTVDGSITVEGVKSASFPISYGSGGSILVVTDAIHGTGTISATGEIYKPCAYSTWPASGGRIAIRSATSDFTGSVTANCTPVGPTPGCDGTIDLAP
jgi:hypothetical protein